MAEGDDSLYTEEERWDDDAEGIIDPELEPFIAALPDGEELNTVLWEYVWNEDGTAVMGADGTPLLTDACLILQARLLETSDDVLTLTQFRAKNNVRVIRLNKMGVQLGGLDASLHTELIEALVRHLAGQKVVDDVHRQHQVYIARQLDLNEPNIIAQYEERLKQEETARRDAFAAALVQGGPNRQMRRHPRG